MVATQTLPCGCCRFPTVAPSGQRVAICSTCEMIAEGRTYSDGSDPAAGLHSGEVRYIQVRVATLRRLATA